MLSRATKLGSQLTKWCEKHSKWWFKQVGLSHWSENARMIVFTLIGLGAPTIIFTYALIFAIFWSHMQITNMMKGKKEHLKNE
jgi:hypothetical protein